MSVTTYLRTAMGRSTLQVDGAVQVLVVFPGIPTGQTVHYDGVTQCGWTSGAALGHAPGNGGHGPTHSGDRMFKSYKTNGSNGEFIAQELGEIALGTYSYSFFIDGLVVL